jgi:hypothetical protein
MITDIEKLQIVPEDAGSKSFNQDPNVISNGPVSFDQDLNVIGTGPKISDSTFTIGSLNYKAAEKWKNAAKKIHILKSLPEIQNSNNSSVFSSPLAIKSGKNPPCRACSKGVKRQTFKGESGIGNAENLSFLKKSLSFLNTTFLKFFPFFEFVADLEVSNITEEIYPKTKNCPVCKGSGESPSSMGGEFSKETRKDEIGNLYVNLAEELFEAENQLGGGVNLNLGGDFSASIGCATNDFDSIRINKEGSENIIGVKLDSEMGLYSSPVTSSTIEMVHVDKFPGGQFTIDAGNGISLYGGSCGCEISSTGPLTLYGTFTELLGEQVNLNSKNGLNLASGEVLSLNGSNIVIESSNQTCMKGNIAIDGNLMCTGGVMIQGELYVQHITGPMEPQLTDFHKELFGTANPDKDLKMGFLQRGQSFCLNIDGWGTRECRIVGDGVPVWTRDCGSLSANSLSVDAFAGCENLTTLNIPDSITSIGINAFRGCIDLRDINVDSNNLVYASVNGVLFDKNITRLITYPAGRAGVFGYSNSYSIPNTVKVIDSFAFNEDTSLDNITIPNSVTSIENSAFHKCENLDDITISASVTSIGINAFEGCKSLLSIDVDSDNPVYASVDGVLFDKNITKLHTYPAGKSGSYTIPNTVTSIGDFKCFCSNEEDYENCRIADQNSIYVYPHQHVYRNLPMTLTETYGDVRKAASENKMGTKENADASSIKPGLKTETIPYMSSEWNNQQDRNPKVSPIKLTTFS